MLFFPLSDSVHAQRKNYMVTQRKGAISKPGKEPLPDTNLFGNLMLDLQSPESEENKCLLFKSTLFSVHYFVMAA